MNKSLLVVVGLIIVAILGYVVYMSFFTVKVDAGKDAGMISNGSENIVSITTSNTGGDKAKGVPEANNVQTGSGVGANRTAGAPDNGLVNLSDDEKVKLLESLKK